MHVCSHKINLFFPSFLQLLFRFYLSSQTLTCKLVGSISVCLIYYSSRVSPRELEICNEKEVEVWVNGEEKMLRKESLRKTVCNRIFHILSYSKYRVSSKWSLLKALPTQMTLIKLGPDL